MKGQNFREGQYEILEFRDRPEFNENLEFGEILEFHENPK